MITEDFVSPYIKLPATWDEYLGSLSSKMRQGIRRERSRCDRENSFELSKVESIEDLAGGFAQLVMLHEQRWKSKGMKGAFSSSLSLFI
jgi:predicted N-acyltransferase